MTWREKLVARLLLLVARMVCDDPAIRQEIQTIATHINVKAPEPELVAAA